MTVVEWEWNVYRTSNAIKTARFYRPHRDAIVSKLLGSFSNDVFLRRKHSLEIECKRLAPECFSAALLAYNLICNVSQLHC